MIFFSFTCLYLKNFSTCGTCIIRNHLNTVHEHPVFPALSKHMGEMSCPKRVTSSREVPLFGAGKRGLVTTGSAGRPGPQTSKQSRLETMAACSSGILGRK